MALPLMLAYLVAATLLGNTGDIVTGLFVPDGISLVRSALDDSGLSAAEILRSYQASGLLAVLNAWIVQWGLFAPAVFNAILLSLVLLTVARSGPYWSVLILMTTPYYLASLVLPSKDILVAAIFLLALHLFADERRQRILVPLLLSLVMVLVRDGFGAILLFVFLYAVIVERLQLGLEKTLLVLAAAAASFWIFFEAAFEGSFIYARAIAVAEQGSNFDADTSSGLEGYAVRLLGNATNLAFRPVLFDTAGTPHVLSFFYAVSGLTLLFALACCIRALGSAGLKDRRMGFVGLSCLILVSITPYIQPRYLLPICLLIPAFSFITVGRLLRGLAVIFLISVAAAAAYMLIGNYPPAAESEPFRL